MTGDRTFEHRLGGLDFLLARGAETYPDRVVIDDRLNGLCLTYGALRDRAIRLAHALRGLGIGGGDRVAYAFYNEHASIEALFACSMLGAIAVPLNTRLNPKEAAPYLAAQGCRLFLARTDLAGLAAGSGITPVIIRGAPADLGPGVAVLDYEALLAGASGAPMPPGARWEDPYMFAMTGGTTGGSKAVAWTHGGSMFDILTVIAHLGIRRGFSTICLAPTYHAAGLGWAFMPSFWQGGRIIFPASPSFSPVAVHHTVAADQVDYLFMVPAMIGPLRRSWDGTPHHGVKSVCIASAPTPEVQRRQLVEMFPAADIVIAYGMTESFSVSVQTPADLLAYPASVGEPAMCSRVRIVDDDGRPLPAGSTGQIVTRTLAMGLGYNNDPVNTAATFKPCTDDPEGLDWIFTGDVGRLDPDGRVTIVDRSKDIVISGGENVPTVEVETVLMSGPGIRECAVVGLPDATWGERVCAVVVCDGGPEGDAERARSLLALCRDRLARYKVPKQFCFIDALPRSAFGKVLKRDLKNYTFERLYETAALD